jgi:hypothetical protein
MQIELPSIDKLSYPVDPRRRIAWYPGEQSYPTLWPTVQGADSKNKASGLEDSRLQWTPGAPRMVTSYLAPAKVKRKTSPVRLPTATEQLPWQIEQELLSARDA